MKLLAIDGNSIMNRAFYGIKALSNKKGTFTNALTGFMNIYLKTAGDISPDCCAVAFDLKEPTFRHKASAAYKANRHGMPDELAMQMPLIKNILRDMGISVIECPGFEADDILGTLAASCGENDSAYILTGDRDSLQLITDNVTVLLHTTKELIRCTPEKFGEMYNGLEPKQLIDLKGLMGDSSDNISGVKGIGEKTALALISEYGSVEGLYEKLGKGEVTATKSVIAKLEVGAQDAKDSKWLATIVTDAPISRNIADYSYKEKDEAALSQLLTELEMTKLMEKLNIKPSAEAPSEAEKLPETEYTLSEMSVNDISGSFAFIFVTGEKPKLYVSYNEKLCCFEDEKDICSLLSSGFEKQTFGAKPAYRYCLEHGTELKNVVSDGDIAGYLLNASASEYTINGLCALYSCPSYEKLDEYADIAALSGLCTRLDKEISDLGMEKLYTETELPLTEVLASMEFYGVKADTDGIREFGNTLCGEIEGLEQQIYFRAGKQFNIASPKQLGAVLFEDLGLPSGKKTKTGYSTNADVLENLRDKDPIIDMIIMYRQYTKLQSTYVEGLLKAVSADGRIHSVFKQTETRTGRISSTEPNLQNIPVRTELGRNMRKFFVSEKGRTLIGRGLQPDRAKNTCTPQRRQKYAGIIHQRQGYPHLHGSTGVRNARGYGNARNETCGKGGKLRHRIWHKRILACKGYRRFRCQSGQIYKKLPFKLPQGKGIYGQSRCRCGKQGLFRDHIRQAQIYPRACGEKQEHSVLRQACGNERPRAGCGGGYHQDSHGKGVPQAERRKAGRSPYFADTR